MGHWTEGSKMPAMYDAVSSSIELAAKNKVVFAFQKGRSLCEPGEIPEPLSECPTGCSFLSQFSSEVEPSAASGSSCPYVNQPIAPLSPAASETCSPAKKPRSKKLTHIPMDESLPPVQVRNGLTGKIHLYHDGIFDAGQPLCGTYNCGLPCYPTEYAEFQKAEDSIELLSQIPKVCGLCYTDAKFRHFRSLGNLYTRNELKSLTWVEQERHDASIPDVESPDPDVSDLSVSSQSSSESSVA